MRDDASEAVRHEAAWELGMTQSEDAVSALKAALADPSIRVRVKAAWALGLIQDASAVAALGRALEDRSTEVRGRAGWALQLVDAPGADLDYPELAEQLRQAMNVGPSSSKQPQR